MQTRLAVQQDGITRFVVQNLQELIDGGRDGFERVARREQVRLEQHVANAELFAELAFVDLPRPQPVFGEERIGFLVLEVDEGLDPVVARRCSRKPVAVICPER